MSQNYESAPMPIMVNVEESNQECIRLGDVMGHVPVRELVEVLDAQGWTVEQAGQVYSRVIAGDITLRVEIGAAGDVTIRRQATRATVQDTERADETVRQQSRLAETAAEYRQAIGEVVGAALIRAVPRIAEEMGLTIVEQQSTPLFERAQVLQFQATLQVEIQG